MDYNRPPPPSLDFFAKLKGCYSSINNCYTNAPFIWGYDNVGGIAGDVGNGTVAYCYCIGIYSSSYGSPIVAWKNGGSIAGLANGSHGIPSKLSYCYSNNAYSKAYTNTATNNTTVTSVNNNLSSKNLSSYSGFSSSIWGSNTSYNSGYPYLKSLEDTYKIYNITVIDDPENSALLNKCFVNVDGILFSQSTNRATAGGAVGYAGLSSSINAAPANNLLVVANRVSASTSGSSYKAQAGKIIGSHNYNALDFNNITSFDEMEVSAVNSANASNKEINSTTGSEKQLSQITQERNLTQIFGPNTYQSLDNLKEHPDAVWVVKNGKLPDLYYNLLRDINISETVNGTISVDKAQAVDDEMVTVTATPSAGYQLNKIYVNGEEIAGTTFEVNGDCDVYATFIEETPEYNVRITATNNASASLVNVDAVNLSGFSLMSVNDNFTATDGDEIKVNTAADEKYTVDAVYVNGEELAGDSFIITENSVVTMDVTSISTDIKATTGNATDIGGYFATLSGSVEGDENTVRYIRYWQKDAPDEVFTTESENGSGEYSVEVTNLEPGATYCYQMTDSGEIKSFVAEPTEEYVYDESEGGGTPTEPDDPTPSDEPITYDYPAFEIKNQQFGTDSISLDIQNNADDEATGTLIIAAYGSNDGIITVRTKAVANIPKDTSKSFDVDVPEAAYYRLFIWKDIKSMLPLSDSIVVR